MAFSTAIQTFDGAHADHDNGSRNCAVDWANNRLWMGARVSSVDYGSIHSISSGAETFSKNITGFLPAIGWEGSHVYIAIAPDIHFGGIAQYTNDTLTYVTEAHYSAPNFGGYNIVSSGGAQPMASTNVGNVIINLNNTSYSNGSTNLGSLGWPNSGSMSAICGGQDGSNYSFLATGGGTVPASVVLRKVDSSFVTTTIATFVPTDLNPSFTQIFVWAMCVDQTDGHPIIVMSGNVAPTYLVKVHKNTGAIVWKVETNWLATQSGAQFSQSRILHQRLGIIGVIPSSVTIYNTADGSVVDSYTSGLGGVSFWGQQCYDDTLGTCIIMCDWDGTSAPTGPAPLNGSAGGFRGWAALYVADGISGSGGGSIGTGRRWMAAITAVKSNSVLATQLVISGAPSGGSTGSTGTGTGAGGGETGGGTVGGGDAGHPPPSPPSAIYFSGTSTADNTVDGDFLGTLTTRDGVAPFTYTTSNSKYRISGDRVLRSSTGSLVAGTPESFNFTSTDANGDSTNTATNGQGPYSVSVFAPGSFSIPLTLYNLDASNAFATPYVSYGHPFKDGDIPAGGSVVVKDSSNATVTSQMDAISTWPSGCVKFAVISHRMTETVAASSSKTYSISSSVSAPDTTLDAGWGANLAAAIATFKLNTDFKAVYSGFDCGANTYTVSANTILTNFNNVTSGWGTSYPLGGWEVMKQGPVCLELHVWQYLRNDSTTNPQGYVRCDMWIKAWSPTGPFEVDVCTNMPNIWNTVSAASEKHNVLPGRFAALVQIKNGSTVVSYQGGPNDVIARTVANADFNTTTNKLTSSVGSFYPQCGVYFTSSGTLPSGISANTIYWPAYLFGGDNAYLMKERNHQAQIEQGNMRTWTGGATYYAGQFAINNNKIYEMTAASGVSAGSGGPTGSGSGITDGTCTWDCICAVFGTQGSGTITACPVYSAFPSCGWAAQDGLGDPIWVGTGSRPNMSPSHDFNYLTQESTFTLPLNPNADVVATNLPLPTPYHPMMHIGGAPSWTIDMTGDGVGDQRIGYMPEFGHAALYLPNSRFYNTIVKEEALSMLTYPFSFLYDESGGHPLIGNNGTNDSGVAYTNLPSLIPTWNASNTAGRPSATTETRGAVWGAWSGTDKDFNGMAGQYYFSTPHMPSLWQVPYLKTGRPIFLMQGVNQANASCVWTYNGTVTLSGHNYRCVQGATIYSQQIRGWAWGWRCLTQAMFITPDSHPQHDYLRDLYDDNAKYQALRLATFPAAQGTFGFMPFADPPDDPSHGIQAPWQSYFCMMVMNMEAWRDGQTSQSRTNSYFDTLRDYYGNFWKLFQSSVDPNACNFISLYRIIYSPNPNDMTNAYTNAGTCFAATYAANWAQQPYITVPFDNDGPGHLITTAGLASNWYGHPALCAMVTLLKSDPGNTVVSGVKTNFISKISARTTVSASLGGMHWGFTQNGITQNATAFSCW